MSQPSTRPHPACPFHALARLAAGALLLWTAACSDGGSESTAGTGGSLQEAESIPEARPSCPEPQPLAVNRSFWHGGFRIALAEGTYEPASPGCSGRVTIAAEFENLLVERSALYSDLLLVSGGFEYSDTTLAHERPYVEPGHSADGALSFAVDEDFDLSAATLFVGDVGEHRAVVPLGAESPDALRSLEPLPVALSSFVLGSMSVTVGAAEVRARDGEWMLPSNQALIRVPVASVYDGSLSPNSVAIHSFVITTPSGMAIESANDMLLGVHQGDTDDTLLDFIVPLPAAGAYVFRATGRVDSSVDGDVSHEEAFTLAALTNFGEAAP